MPRSVIIHNATLPQGKGHEQIGIKITNQLLPLLRHGNTHQNKWVQVLNYFMLRYKGPTFVA